MFQFANVAVDGYEDTLIGHGKLNGFVYNYIVEWLNGTALLLLRWF
jgi:hypothetical protein